MGSPVDSHVEGILVGSPVEGILVDSPGCIHLGWTGHFAVGRVPVMKNMGLIRRWWTCPCYRLYYWPSHQKRCTVEVPYHPSRRLGTWCQQVVPTETSSSSNQHKTTFDTFICWLVRLLHLICPQSELTVRRKRPSNPVVLLALGL